MTEAQYLALIGGIGQAIVALQARTGDALGRGDIALNNQLQSGLRALEARMVQLIHEWLTTFPTEV